jgi:hypothetical protein
MKMISFNTRLFSCLLLAGVALSSCSSSPQEFSGVWDGRLADLDNNCPFIAVPNLNELFPMTVSEDELGVIHVQAATGERAVGGQGDGETISFVATSPAFGDYDPARSYPCGPSISQVGFITQGDDEAHVSVVISFNSCAAGDGSGTLISCYLSYRGEATKR